MDDTNLLENCQNSIGLEHRSDDCSLFLFDKSIPQTVLQWFRVTLFISFRTDLNLAAEGLSSRSNNISSTS